MKCHILFPGKNKKNISKCHLLKILPRVLSVNMSSVDANSICDVNLGDNLRYVFYPKRIHVLWLHQHFSMINLSLAEHDMPCLNKQCRSRSVGF